MPFAFKSLFSSKKSNTSSRMSHATATFNGQVIAESDTYQTVEGNIYFPPSSLISQSHFTPSTLTTFCPWKGTASYYNLSVNGDEAKDAAWYYPELQTEKAKDLGIQGNAALFHLGPLSTIKGISVVLSALETISFPVTRRLFKHQNCSTSKPGTVSKLATHCAKLWLLLDVKQ
ncbi:MAG: hypothetical protein Q9212_001547 [Teloschistes hypoglaucus]